MTVLVLVILLVLALVVAGVGLFAFALARSSKKTMVQNAVIPGVAVAVPAEWGGSHDPEARLHRRIRDAVAALDATIGMTGVDQIDVRARLMVSAQQLDERLVAIWSLPRQARQAPLAEVESGVAALESEAAAVASSSDDALGGYVSPPAMPPVRDITDPAPDQRRRSSGTAE
ncbi:hypothetical protein [Gordonia humi]|uniref:Uncharacterized protein n=1 Tax=Gordonia humi TaxID=686429 RepID=A0A840EVR0_9ACTN|nr:hypothetical protein [Gordonia humi]MBB4134438.1 hypothetical protein [Gordonia humi]